MELDRGTQRANRIELCAWLLAIAVAVVIDGPVARALRESGLPSMVKGHWLAEHVVKAPGRLFFVGLVMVALSLWHPLRSRAAMFVLLCSVVAGLEPIGKWAVGRFRPFKLPGGAEEPSPFVFQPFRGGWEGLTKLENLAFPSGHGLVAFATAAALGMLMPRWKWVFYAWAIVLGLERIAENAHWVSDVAASGFLAVGAAHLAAIYVWPAIERYRKRVDLVEAGALKAEHG